MDVAIYATGSQRKTELTKHLVYPDSLDTLKLFRKLKTVIQE